MAETPTTAIKPRGATAPGQPDGEIDRLRVVYTR